LAFNNLPECFLGGARHVCLGKARTNGIQRVRDVPDGVRALFLGVEILFVIRAKIGAKVCQAARECGQRLQRLERHIAQIGELGREYRELIVDRLDRVGVLQRLIYLVLRGSAGRQTVKHARQVLWQLAALQGRKYRPAGLQRQGLGAGLQLACRIVGGAHTDLYAKFAAVGVIECARK